MSSTVPLSFKWGKQIVDLPNFEVDSGVKGLKQELFEQTGVPIERQKIMGKTKKLCKGILKDDVDISHWKALATKQSGPLQLLLMGSAEAITKPTSKTVFIEDLPEEERAKVNPEPSGLVNLGNTCYMNSVLQCLRVIPSFQDDLGQNNNATNPFAQTLKQTYQQMNATETALEPHSMVLAVKAAFPQFAQLTRDGRPMQQDAEEFYSGLLNKLETHQFDIELTETLKCTEDDSEEPTTRHDKSKKLTCNIQGGADGNAKNITHVAEGISLGLTGTIQKRSETLQRDALYSKQAKISKLPQVLCVQFGRFFWKATPDSQDHAGVKCKVMKPVAFSDTLDVYDFCDDSLQEKLKKARHKKLAEEEEAIQRKLQGQDDEKAEAPDTDETAMQVDDDPELAAALAMSMESDDDIIVQEDLPKNFQGHYELFAVVTHKGRDADGGHYMGWVKSDHQDHLQKISDTDIYNENWFVFDDEDVSPCKTEDIIKLKGGGDWHMSYLNFYRVKK